MPYCRLFFGWLFKTQAHQNSIFFKTQAKFCQNSSKIFLKLNFSENFAPIYCFSTQNLVVFSKIPRKISKFIENSTKSFKNSRILWVKTQEICQNSIFWKFHCPTLPEKLPKKACAICISKRSCQSCPRTFGLFFNLCFILKSPKTHHHWV